MPATHQPRSSWALAIAALTETLRGGSSVQFGLVAPSLLLFVFGIIEVGRMLRTMNALHYSVEEAARCASINAATCGSAGKAQAVGAARSCGTFASSVF